MVTITELRTVSAAAFGHRYRLELLSALATAAADQGISLSLLADCCGVTASVYYPPVQKMAESGMVVTSGPDRTKRRVLYARSNISVWTGLRVIAEDLAVDVDLASAALSWPVAP
jgi:hypothetical protein